MKKLQTKILMIFAVFSCSAAVSLKAGEPWELTRAAGNFRQYTVADSTHASALAVPRGFSLFCIEHYGRHGSRFHTDYARHDSILAFLNRYEAVHALTTCGTSLLEEVKTRRTAMTDRLGELTPVGANQHKAIARRMTERYRQLFVTETRLRAISSPVVRCVLSMANAIGEIRGLVLGLDVSIDASATDQPMLRNMSSNTDKGNIGSGKGALEEYCNANPTSRQWLFKIIKPEYASAVSDEEAEIMADKLFDILADTPSEGMLSPCRDIFSDNDISLLARKRNARWFVECGDYLPGGGRGMNTALMLLDDMIKRSDEAMARHTPSVDLRFGHESTLLPLLCLMQIDSCGRGYTALSDLSGHWESGEVFPMASNLQLVFCRNSAGKVLVKALLNENEAQLPVVPDLDGWTDWETLKAYYIKRIAWQRTRHS